MAKGRADHRFPDQSRFGNTGLAIGLTGLKRSTPTSAETLTNDSLNRGWPDWPGHPRAPARVLSVSVDAQQKPGKTTMLKLNHLIASEIRVGLCSLPAG